MGVWTDRLAFMRETQSLASIARTAGVPYSMLQRVARGGELPTGYAGKLQPVYKKNSYARLTAAGTPSRDASNYAGGDVGNIRRIIKDIDTKVHFYARGVTLVHFAKQRLMLGNEQVKAYYDRQVERIRNAFKKSIETVTNVLADRYGKG